MQALEDDKHPGDVTGPSQHLEVLCPSCSHHKCFILHRKDCQPYRRSYPPAMTGISSGLIKTSSPRGKHGNTSLNTWAKCFKNGERLAWTSMGSLHKWVTWKQAVGHQWIPNRLSWQGWMVSLSTKIHCLGWEKASIICISLTFHSFILTFSCFHQNAFPDTKRSC